MSNNTTTVNKQNQNPVYVEEVIEKLEQEGFEELQQVLNANEEAAEVLAKKITLEGKSCELSEKEKESLNEIQNSLMSIIVNGAKKFEKETGREMTYAEMRAAYG